MTTKYVEDGMTLDYTEPGSAAIASGAAVPLSSNGSGMLCVAHDDIALSGDGVLHAEGVFQIPKVSAAVITKGEQVFWVASAAAVDDDQATKATGDFTCGTAWESAGNGVTTIAVKLNGFATPLT